MGLIILSLVLCIPAFIIQMSVSAITATDDGFGKAFGAWIMTLIAGFAAGYLVGMLQLAPTPTMILAQMAGIVTFAMVIQVSYDMSFKDAMKVWLVNVVIWIIVVIALIVFGFGAALLAP